VMHPVELLKLQGLPHLRQLYLPGPIWNPGGSNEDRKGVFEAFSTLSGVQRLAFGWHYNAQIEIGDKDLQQLFTWKDLRELRCSQCQLANLSLAPFTKLENLDLSYNPFTDKAMEGLAGLSSLRRLYLRDTLVTDEGLKHLSGLSKLEELDPGSFRTVAVKGQVLHALGRTDEAAAQVIAYAGHRDAQVNQAASLLEHLGKPDAAEEREHEAFAGEERRRDDEGEERGPEGPIEERSPACRGGHHDSRAPIRPRVSGVSGQLIETKSARRRSSSSSTFSAPRARSTSAPR